ncbi:hypothetical protein [Novosphingobium sp. P6W]|uniref:hypothetical protein n=1 Tax=Novosphingobium sp. P6W TaxID=1609758 RepID=UPI0013B3CFD4|nr:hypothetical protein [Novosphingobium sp. P6W]
MIAVDHDASPCSCPLCVDDVPEEIVARIKASAAAQGTTMTQEEFLAWLDGVGRKGPEAR